MLRIIRTRQAREDILELWEFVAADHVAAADKLLRRIDEMVGCWPNSRDSAVPRTSTGPACGAWLSVCI